MDFNLKQWREHQQHDQSDHDQAPTKLPRLLLDHHPQQLLQQQQPPSASSALPLFVTEPTSKLSSNLSAYPPDSTATATKFSRMGSYFSLAQWQELELQALIYRHILAGAAVPPELLHLVKKSLINSSHPYYHPHPFQHYPHLQPPAALLQSGYWGRGAMDPEPGRCRRTDGKKWRCSRDVVSGQKYCERHMHRGRNRSRKPVEIPTTATPSGSTNAAPGMLKANTSISTQPLAAIATSGSHFTYSGPSPSIDLLHLSHRSSESMVETRNDASGNEKSGGQILRHFFDDWPRSLQESDNAGSSGSSVTSATNISISDFSLKLSTGDGYDSGPQAGNVERGRCHSNWSGSWGTNQVASMGGPLAEALRSSTSNSSPTSVLHEVPRASASEASYVST